jgi:hypothetical protein
LRAFVHAGLRVRVQLFSRSERFLFHFDFLVQGDQVRVQPDHAVDGGDQLQPQEKISDFPLVLGDADEAAVYGQSESVQ